MHKDEYSKINIIKYYVINIMRKDEKIRGRWRGSRNEGKGRGWYEKRRRRTQRN